MERIALDLAWGGRTIAFAGEKALYERWILPLVGGIYGHAPAAGEAPRTAAPAEAAGGRSAQAAIAAAAPARAAPARPERPLFRPEAPAQFHAFAAQVGDRATGPDKRIMAFAFYLWNYEKRTRGFTLEEAVGFFHTIVEEPPADLASILDDLAGERGFLERRDDRWSISNKGVGFVKGRLLGQF